MRAAWRRHAALALGALALASLGACGRSRGITERPITIVADPRPFASIEEAAAAEDRVDWWDADSTDDVACTVSFAALELRRHLARALRVAEGDVRLAIGPSLPDSGTAIVLGTSAGNALGPSLAPLPKTPAARPDGYRLRTVRPRGSRRDVLLLQGNAREGVLSATYGLLDRLGLRFYGLGDSGVVLPASAPVLPRRLDVADDPEFWTRGFWAWEDRGGRDFLLWMARNRLNFWTAAGAELPFRKKLGLRLSGGGHTIQSEYLNPAEDYPYDHAQWRGDEGKPADPHPAGPEPVVDRNHDGKLSRFEAHPEWYALVDGVRSDRIAGESGDNFCTSNAEAVRELTGNLIESLQDGDLAGVDVLELWPLDTGRWCECDACRAIGTPSDRLLRLARDVGHALVDARADGRLAREVEIEIPAYLETAAPPTQPLPEGFARAHARVTFFPYLRCYVHAMDDPACTERNARWRQAFDGWAAALRDVPGALGIGEYYNVSFFKSLPIALPRSAGPDLRTYRAAGARSFHFMHVVTSAWGPWTYTHAMLAPRLWRPGADADSLAREFLVRWYPTTSATMASFYRHLETATSNLILLDVTVGAFGDGNIPGGRLVEPRLPLFSSAHLRYTETHPPSDDGPDMTEIVSAVDSARAELDQAIGTASNAVERARLLDDRSRFGYGERMLHFYDRLLRVAMADRSGDVATARVEFAAGDSIARELRQIRDLVRTSSSHANAEDGFAATQVTDTWDVYRRRYGAGR